MTIFIMDPICEEAVARLSARGPVVNFPQSRETDWTESAEALLVRTWPVRADDIARAKNLRIIAKHGTGVDNIDVAAAKARGVLVTNTPGANARAVSEYVLALTFALARRVTLADRTVRAGVWRQPAGVFEIEGKTVGLVGFGDIGGRVARMFAHGLGAKVIAYDPFARPEAFAAAGAVGVADLGALLESADVVSLHVPLTEKTRNLIAAAELARMKPGSVLINVARGGIVDEAALYDALSSGRLAGAACDVFVEEPVPATHPLLGLDTFIASPHAAGSSGESLVRMGLGAADSIIDLLDGRQPRNIL